MSITAKAPVAKGVSTDSIYAWKAANVYVTQRHSNLMRFRPMIMAHPTYGITDSARCAVKKDHSEPPYDGCRCGFNAWHDFTVARTYLREVINARCLCYGGTDKWVSCVGMLYVRLEGDVIEGTLDAMNLDKWGYRSAVQRVTDVFFADTCGFCGGDADGLSTSGKTTTLPNVPGGVLFLPVRPACSKCSPALLHPNELMANNDVGVQLGYPSE